MITRKPFGGRQGTSRVIADASLPITIQIGSYDETVRITKLAGTFSIMIRLDGTPTSVADGTADTPLLVGQSILLNRGANPASISLGVGPDGASVGGWTIVQTGSGGVA